ncbi:MAG: spore coat protein CotJB, partial [Clostridia bacterium]|nr:spore coat protein CotJB [Clostridia bacterium]
LYLDTHPTDSDALEQYERYKLIRQQAVREYTDEFGPLTAYDVKSTGKWCWAMTPMPWEKEANC